MKSAFSLLEIIIGILIIGLVSSFAIPKLLDSKDFANATTLKRDILSIVSSAKTYKLQNSDFTNIEDAIEINTNLWTQDNATLSDNSECLNLELSLPDSIEMTSTKSTTEVCDKLYKTIFKEDETSKTFIL